MGPSPRELAFSFIVRIPLFCIFVTVSALGGAACRPLSHCVSLFVLILLALRYPACSFSFKLAVPLGVLCVHATHTITLTVATLSNLCQCDLRGDI